MTVHRHLYGTFQTMCLQFGWLRGTARFIQRALVRAVEPYLIPSFSQFGEDRIMGRFLNSIEKGVYVEVGCNHPVRFSNTWTLYRHGWSGLVIDANSGLIKKFAKVRPRDRAIYSVVSDEVREVDFYFVRKNALLSGVKSKTHSHWKRTAENSSIEKLKSTRLDDLLRQHLQPGDIDFLSVDVEGHELEVLSSLDWLQYSPFLIVVEMHEFELEDKEESPVYEYLRKKNYQLKAFDGTNGYFVKQG